MPGCRGAERADVTGLVRGGRRLLRGSRIDAFDAYHVGRCAEWLILEPCLSPRALPVRQESASVGRSGLPTVPANLTQAIQLDRCGRGYFEYW